VHLLVLLTSNQYGTLLQHKTLGYIHHKGGFVGVLQPSGNNYLITLLGNKEY